MTLTIDSSCLTTPSPTDRDPSFAERDRLREARQLDEGVCTSNNIVGCSFQERNGTVAPPQSPSPL
ncbi:uncharacterized protein VP01_531g2 [Puccinia sorghi]|uniref:Uncharacterized protein n=1 Tax=Puccinia sorghi TaxID=27349 RepID=A0A0L6UK64_9BASI|nr:uncharacterized protein VP01_531g2 [Puccinia sorghi]